MKRIKILFNALLAVGIMSLIIWGCKEQNVQPSVTSNAKGGTTAGAYDAITLSCGEDGNTQSTISLTVTAGATGAPAGFSIQWMTKDQFDALGGVWPADTTSFCKASFSGVPYGSKNTQQAGSNSYNLSGGQSVTVYIGDLLNDELNQQLGLSTDCNSGLQCGTQYVFRAFAHANSTKNRSAFSFLTDPCATTAQCGTCGHHGYGYWKNHPELVTDLTVGVTNYTAAQINAILNTVPKGNGYITLAHQLISAKLNGLCDNVTGTANAAFNSVTFSGTTAPVTVNTSTTEATLAGLISTLHKHNENCLDCPQ
ncbi:MAG TPA: hypothetical protein VL442_22640 [Mucilaginibacter sp.]|nr:hypothetical protein [Mucilaginibacter sp.]